MNRLTAWTKKPFLGTLPLLAVSIAALAATVYTMDNARSRLGFTATQSGGNFDGRFRNFKADIVFSDRDLANSRFDVTIDMKSVDTGDDQRDEALRDEDLFAAKKFPTARFTAATFTRKASGQYEAVGKLTIRDVTRDIRLPFTFESKNNESWLKGGVTLKRLDYGVGQGDWKDTSEVANEVKVTFALRLLPAAGKKTIPKTPPAGSAK